MYEDLLTVKQNKLQRGFTKGVSPTNAALILTEAIAESKDTKRPIYATFVDATKAFDVVWHSSMLVKLFNYGLKILHGYYFMIGTKV